MSTVSLGEDLGIEASAELQERLAACLDEPVVELDGTAVRRVHTASMQVLCAFFRSRRQSNHNTHLSGCSESLRDAARLLGLSAQLGLSPNEQAKQQSVENAA